MREPHLQTIVATDTPASPQTDDAGRVPVLNASGQLDSAFVVANAPILFQDDGSDLGAVGTADTVDFVGSGVTATRVGDVVTVTIPGGSGGGNLEYVGTAVVAGAAATALTISFLDLATDEMYFFRANLLNATGSAANLSGYANADFTATNYNRENLTVSAASTSPSNANNAFAGFLDANAPARIEGWIFRDRAGRVQVTMHSRRGLHTAIGFNLVTVVWTTTGANLTDWTLSSSVASSLSIGDTMDFFRVTQ